jgi:hypothetical protein
MSSLTASPIDANETERLCTVLLKEFWKSYFDGNAHDVGNGPLNFPQCEVCFNQVTPDLNGPVIHTIYATLRPGRQHDAPASAGAHKRRVQVDAVLNMFFRVPNSGQAKAGGDPDCRRIADLAKQVLESPSERARLAEKGLLRPRILSGPTPQPFPGQQVRLMIVSAQLIYRI